jgi:HD-GYP domain-containing protein (c-di-GMP phosphodiesterase class II)
MDFKRVPLTMLRDGALLASGIYDAGGRLLLRANVPITRELLATLYKRGIDNVVISQKDWTGLASLHARGTAREAPPNRPAILSDIANATTRELDAATSLFGNCDIVPAEKPFSDRIDRRRRGRFSVERLKQIAEHRQVTVDLVTDVMGRLTDDRPVSVEHVHSLAAQSLSKAAEDLDLFVCPGVSPSVANSIFVHSTNVAALAVAIGVNLALSEEQLCELAMGCLVHDAGMLRIDPQIHQSPKILDAREFAAIARHPVIAAELLARNMPGAAQSVQMVVYQMHERCNGTGYPRGNNASAIHPLAKIASVADVYVALISPRPHRPALLPYFAIMKLLRDGAAGLFDSAAVRSLLHTLSLFPIGSFCELSNGLVAKTIRTNGPLYDRPVVAAWRPDRVDEEPQVIDLSERTDLSVLKPLSVWEVRQDMEVG